MKDHIPIKRHQAIVTFSRDHHFGLLLVWKIRQGLKRAVNAELISNYVLYYFQEDIEKHFKEEEAFLFSKLAVDDDLRLQAEQDHLAIYNQVAAIRENKSNTVLLNQFADELENHIRFEERKLFNHLQSQIALSELEKIAKRFSNNGELINEKWEDVFWLASKPDAHL